MWLKTYFNIYNKVIKPMKFVVVESKRMNVRCSCYDETESGFGRKPTKCDKCLRTEEFTELLDKYIVKGWVLQGGISTYTYKIYKTPYLVFVQMLVSNT